MKTSPVLTLISLLLTGPTQSLFLSSSPTRQGPRGTCERREWLCGLVVASGSSAASILVSSPLLAQSISEIPLDFTVQRETKLPFSQYYVENARRLVVTLRWAATHPDAAVDEQMKQQILAFSSLYRRDNYTQYGPLPGLQSLQTAYLAAAEHYVRNGFGQPMGTVGWHY